MSNLAQYLMEVKHFEILELLDVGRPKLISNLSDLMSESDFGRTNLYSLRDLDILRTIPTSARAKSIAVPPWLTKISGMPVSGTIPSIDAIFINDWEIIRVIIPTTNSPLNILGECEAIFNPRKVNNTNNVISRSAPTIPHSSANTAKIESLVASGK